MKGVGRGREMGKKNGKKQPLGISKENKKHEEMSKKKVKGHERRIKKCEKHVCVQQDYTAQPFIFLEDDLVDIGDNNLGHTKALQAG